jgi:hypothetical protein
VHRPRCAAPAFVLGNVVTIESGVELGRTRRTTGTVCRINPEVE